MIAGLTVAAMIASLPPQTFALVIGVNQSVDPELPQLRYADDDAIEFFRLFTRLGAAARLLTRADDNTRRLHPEIVAQVAAPTADALRGVVQDLAERVEAAQARGIQTRLYVVYTGHGNVDEKDRGYVSLDGSKLLGEEIASEIIETIGAEESHLIVDACHSYSLAHGRGPGGQRRPIEGFSALKPKNGFEGVGLLLSTSEAKESHEWEGIQAGIFSYEVRSALYGSADVDGDGMVSYRELAAFVTHANAAIPDERFRPAFYLRPPPGGDQLMPLAGARSRRIEIGGAAAAHYFLEDSKGVRLAEAHNARGQALNILLPAAERLYLRRVDDEREYELPSDSEVLRLADLAAREPRGGSRGAAHDAFSLLFTLPFSRRVVEEFAGGLERAPLVPNVEARTTLMKEPAGLRSAIGLGVIGLGAAVLGGGFAVTISTKNLRDGTAGQSHQTIVEVNDRISTRNTIGAVLYSGAAVALVAGTLILFWPREEAPAPVAVVSDQGTFFGFSGVF